MIDWKPIDQLPEELKDGRPVLLWVSRRGGPSVIEGGIDPKGRVTEWSDRDGDLA